MVAPAARDLDIEHTFPTEIVSTMGELGFFRLGLSPDVGGIGDFTSYGIAVEEIAWADAGVAVTLEAAVSLGITPIHDLGTPEQKRELLPELTDGRHLWSFGLTEPGAHVRPGAHCGASARILMPRQ